MSKLLKKSLFALGVVLLPAFASAQTVMSILDRVQQILNIIIPIVMTLALLYFFMGLAKYITGTGDEEARKAGREMMVYGIIALFVMAAVWGLVGVVGRTFGVQVGGGAPVNSGNIIPR